MALTVATSSTGVVSASTSVSVPNPGFTTGQYIVAIFEGISTPSSVTAPASFGALTQNSVGDNGVTAFAMGKWATGAEPASYAWSWTPSNYVRITMIGLTGFSISTGVPLAAAALRGSTSATSSIIYPSTRVDVDDGILIFAAALYDNRAYQTLTNFTAIQSTTGRLHTWQRSDPPMVVTGNLTETLTDGTTHYASMGLHFSPTTVPSPVWITKPTISGTVARNGVLTVNTGIAQYATFYTVQWQRNTGSGWVNISGQTATTYTLSATDSKATVRANVTANGAAGSTTQATLGVSYYEQTSADIGHDLTATVTGRNTAGTASATSNAITTQFQNTAPPVISGGTPTMTAGATLTVGAGTYVETVTSRSYQWSSDGVVISGVTGSTFTPGEEYGSRRITVRENVSGPLGTGTAASSDFRFFPAMTVPFATVGSPYRQEIPADAPIDNAMTSTLQGYLTSMYGVGRIWYGEGGPYGNGYASYLIVVDSSMPRTAFDLAPLSGYGGTPETATKNGAARNHLAWCFKTKNGGVPTPPAGFKVVDGTDQHMTVYCRDTHELWTTWVTNLTDYANPRFWNGAYIPDVTQFVGYFQDLTTTPGTEGDPEKQFSIWGEQAVNMPMWEGILTMRELLVDGSIEHMIGILQPGTNHTARWPDVRIEASGVGSMPHGGIWQVDPDLDPASLPSLGNATMNAFRANMISALQRYGATSVDTTNANFAIRWESVTNTSDSWTWGANLFVPSLDQMMKSIPVTSWRVLSTAYRPAGGEALPPSEDIATQHFLPATDWTAFGGGIDGTGRLTLGAYGGDGGQAYTSGANPLTIDGSAMYVNMAQVTKTTRFQARSVSGATSYIGFEYVDTSGLLRAVASFSGAVVGTTATATYSSTSHAWWRIRTESGNIIWETSADTGLGTPASWTTFRTVAIPGTFFDLDQCYIYFQALGGTIGVSEGSMVARNLSEIPAPVATSGGWVVGVS